MTGPDIEEARRLLAAMTGSKRTTGYWPERAKLELWAVNGGLSRLLSKIEEMEKARTDFYAVVERLGLAEMIESDDDDNTTSTWVNGRADFAERSLGEKEAEVERLKRQLHRPSHIAAYEMVPDEATEEKA